MSELIEQLGGYSKSKDIVSKAPSSTYTYHNHPYQKGYIRCWGGDGEDHFLVSDIEKELLEYRRKHNIFEVGDKVVHPKFGDTRLYEVREVKGSLVLVYFDRLSYSFRDDLRHATDEEIKQGRRL